MPAIAKPLPHRWTYAEWDRMVSAGFLEGQRVEFIDGEILDMAPQRDIHAAAVSLAFKAIWRVIGDKVWVRWQLPLRLNDDSEPEPDVSVVKGGERNYIGTGHPSEAILVIEVADSSLDYDREDKASLYASAGIADYWILNLLQRQCEVHRNPIADATERFGCRYDQITIHKPGDSIAPLAAPNRPVAINAVIP